MQQKLEGKQKSGIVPGCSLANERELGCWQLSEPIPLGCALGCPHLTEVITRCQLLGLFLLINAFPAFLKDVKPNR